MPPILQEIPDIDSFIRQGACLGIDHDMLVVGWGNVVQNAIPSLEGTSFYLNDYLLSYPQPWFSYEYNARIMPSSLVYQIGKPDHLYRAWSEPDWVKFKTMFDQVQAAIARGKLTKAVPLLRSRGNKGIDSKELRSTLGHVLRLAPGLTPYGMWHPSGGLLGASPELLFASSENEVRSNALAGTARPNEEHNPLTDPKEQTEHRIVVDFLSSQFKLLGQPEVGETKMKSFGNISHLITQVCAKIVQSCSFSDLVKLLHPTPALGVDPQDRWRMWAYALGHQHGDFFAAPFGVSLPRQVLQCISCIRGIQWSLSEVTCTAGCGIIRNSQLKHEQGEISHKLNTIMENLGSVSDSTSRDRNRHSLKEYS